MAQNGRKLGKMGLVILDVFVEIKLGDKYNKKLSAQTEEQSAITVALNNTAGRLWKDWADKRPWNALFVDLPKKKGLLTDLQQAARKFYLHPTDMDFSGVLVEILHEHNELSPEAVQKAVGEYTTALAEELLLVDKGFQNHLSEQPDQQRGEIMLDDEEHTIDQPPHPYQQTDQDGGLNPIEGTALPAARIKPKKSPVKKIPKSFLQTDDGTILKPAEEAALPAARVKPKKLPVKKIPKPYPQTDDGTSLKPVEEAALPATRVKSNKSPVKKIPKPFLQTDDGTSLKPVEEAALPATRVKPKKSPVKKIPKPFLQADDGTSSKPIEEAALPAARVKPKKSPVKKIPKPFLQTDDGTSLKPVEEAALPAARVKPKKSPVKKIPKPYPKTEDGTTSLPAEVTTLQAARAMLQKLPLKEIPEPAELPKGSRFPDIPPDPRFVGREEALKQLATWLKDENLTASNPVAAITGMEGAGKTQLACEFAQRYGRYFSGGVFWLSFSQPDLIPFEVAACGGLSDYSPLEFRVRQVLMDWKTAIPRLLIFDNCEDPLLLTKWLPTTGGSRVLVTSRQDNWDPALEVQTLPLEPLLRSASITLLRGTQWESAADDLDLDAIASELEDLPLALHMAGCFLDTYRQNKNPGEYLEALRQPRPFKFRSLRIGEFSPTGLELKLERPTAIGIDRLSQEGENTRLVLDLLRQIACFAPGEWIPLELLPKSTGTAQIAMAALRDRVNQLLGMGLVDENRAGDVRMHRLVAWFIRDILPDEGEQRLVGNELISSAIAANQSGYPARMRPLLVHLKLLTDQALKNKNKRAARLADELGYYLEANADYPGARSYYLQAMEINRKVLGEEHPDTTVSYNKLGGLLVKMGDYPGARLYYRRSLETHRKVLGEEHPDTASSLNDLGELTARMGDYPGARRYILQALAIRRRLLGEEHPDTASSLNNLGGLMAKMGDYPSARSYYEQALAIRRKVLGEEHPDTAKSLTDMGELMQAEGDQVGARSNFEQALAIRRKVLGEEHPATAAGLTSLGGLLQAMIDYPGARSCFEQALAINKKVLGEAHPATITGLNNLGNLLQAMDDQPGARSYFEQVRTINRKIQEGNRPETPSRKGLLALPWRTRIALAALLVLAVTVIGWQVFSHQNVSSTSMDFFIATPSVVNVEPNAWLFPQLGPKATRTASRTPTMTRTRMPSPTRTKYMSPTPTNTVPYVLLPSRSPTKTSPPTRYPSAIPASATPTIRNTVPTNTPTFVPTPTSAIPTLVPSDTPVYVTPTVAPPPTDTPLPTDTPAPPPTDTTVPMVSKEVIQHI